MVGKQLEEIPWSCNVHTQDRRRVGATLMICLIFFNLSTLFGSIVSINSFVLHMHSSISRCLSLFVARRCAVHRLTCIVVCRIPYMYT